MVDVYIDGPLKGQEIIRIDDLVEWRADGEMMVDFFTSLYRHCSTGFLHYRAFPYFMDDPKRRLFFDISNGFEELPKIISEHQEEGFRKGKFRREYFFDLNLYGSPKHTEEDVVMVAAVQVDVDGSFDEKILEKIPPSLIVKTRGFEYSPDCVDHFHFYWILKKPVKPSVAYQKVMIRLYKLFFDHRYWYLCTGYQLHARIPGTLNYYRERVTFTGFEREYSFDFFENFLPEMNLADTLYYINAYWQMFKDPKRGIVDE